MRRILILGATSELAIALAHKLAEQRQPLCLGARNTALLKEIASDLQLRYQIDVTLFTYKAASLQQNKKNLAKHLHNLKGVISVIGFNGDQELAKRDEKHRAEILSANFIAPLASIEQALPHLALVENSFVAGISSVAGERGRKKNYFYGSAKAAFTAALSGLRQRYHGRVHILTVKPGFFYSKATRHMNLPGHLTVEATRVAEDVLRAINKKKQTIYSPWFWRYIMLIVRNLPEFIFKRTSF